MRPKSHLLVNLSYLQFNLEQLQKLAPKTEILFMVKANAYGHGLLKIVDYSFRELQLKSFGLASLGEALALRRASENYEYEIYIFSDLSIKDHVESYLDFKLLPVITQMEDLLIVLNHAKCRYLPLVLHFDTGMNRLGLPLHQSASIIEELKKRGRSVYHLMTHFSDSYLPQKKKTQLQYQKFLQLKADFKNEGVEVKKTSVGNSGAIENGIGLGPEETTIRPGLMLYGMRSNTSPACWSGKIISSLRAEVLDVRPVKKGESIGYGSTPSPRAGTLCILGLGYGDGITNHYQKLSLRYQQFQGTIIGRINMDMIQTVFPPEFSPKRGHLIPLWEHCQERMKEVSLHTQLTPYEITCLLKNRIPRIYQFKGE